MSATGSVCSPRGGGGGTCSVTCGGGDVVGYTTFGPSLLPLVPGDVVIDMVSYPEMRHEPFFYAYTQTSAIPILRTCGTLATAKVYVHAHIHMYTIVPQNSVNGWCTLQRLVDRPL